jgi:hypothetical protein
MRSNHSKNVCQHTHADTMRVARHPQEPLVALLVVVWECFSSHSITRGGTDANPHRMLPRGLPQCDGRSRVAKAEDRLLMW